MNGRSTLISGTPIRAPSGTNSATVAAAASVPRLADLFGRLAADDPNDSAAWFNRALCLAWAGKNLEAI